MRSPGGYGAYIRRRPTRRHSRAGVLVLACSRPTLSSVNNATNPEGQRTAAIMAGITLLRTVIVSRIRTRSPMTRSATPLARRRLTEHPSRYGHGNCDRTMRPCHRMRHQSSNTHSLLSSLLVVVTVAGVIVKVPLPQAHAAPAPEVEYLYDVSVRRHYSFPNNDAVGYGREICDKVSQGESYAQVMDALRRDVTPNDEFAANYLVSYAVNILCPAQIWQLRRSAAGYQPPGG